MRVLYGKDHKYIDVTEPYFGSLSSDNIVLIPPNDDTRARLFGDPLFGHVKHVMIQDDFGSWIVVPHNEMYFNRKKDGKLSHGDRVPCSSGEGADIDSSVKSDILHDSRVHPKVKLAFLQSQLSISFGDKYDEYPEQLMSVTFIEEDDCVLEIGGNIGRNSCIIASLLKDSRNLVVLECSPRHAVELQINRDANHLHFHIEPSALSAIPLIQKGWDTKPLDATTLSLLSSGWSSVPTMDWNSLLSKYPSCLERFNVLVADCEGALFFILRDFPSLLDSVHKIILENDFHIKEQGDWVHDFLRQRGFVVAYSQSGGWGHFQSCFFQVWHKV